MPGLKRKGIVALVVVGLMAFSTVAVGAPTEDDDADTIFNFGYDEEFHYLFWSSSPVDGEDCALEDGEVAVAFDEGAPSIEGFLCELMGAEVAGPNGQINHGQFMKLFNSMYAGQGRGCLNRFLAKSGLGKGDQQIKVGDDMSAFIPADESTEFSVVFETHYATCDKGNRHDTDGAGASGKVKGNSANAPGHNKGPNGG